MRSDHPHVDIDREIDKFTDYWHARAGKGSTKLDWNATFRNWIRREAEKHQPTNNANRNGLSTVDAKVHGWATMQPPPGYRFYDDPPPYDYDGTVEPEALS